MSDDVGELARSINGAGGLAALLRRLRADRDLSQEDLAERIGRPPEFVADLEGAREPDPTLSAVSLLAHGCEVSVSLFVASFAVPRGEPLPWPRQHVPPGSRPWAGPAGAHAFGATLREERLRLNWTMARCGERAGLTAAEIGQLERGQVANPTLLTVTRLSHALASTTPRQIALASRLAQSYAGEIDAPKLSTLRSDAWAPAREPD